MDDFTKLPNIGKVLSDRLHQAGIEDLPTLRTLGPKEAFLRIRRVEPGSCLNSLYAIAGALEGIRWHNLDIQQKKDLRAFYEILK